MLISAIIATYNRKDTLARCLASLFEQDLDRDQYEIVVVVDGSTDGTCEMLDSLQYRRNLVVILQENRGQTAALNAGVAATSGNLVLFLDDDLVCDYYLLSSHVIAHKDNPRALVFGRMQGASGYKPTFAELWTNQNLDNYYQRLERDSSAIWPDDAWVGPNCSLSRALFLNADGYDGKLFPSRGEDVDLGFRLWKMGVAFRYCPRAVTSHHWVKSSRQLWRDERASGASIISLCRRHPEYRTQVGFSGALNSSISKYFAIKMLACRPVAAVLGVLVWLLEIGPDIALLKSLGIRLFNLRQKSAVFIGAREEAGSWQKLTSLFSGHLAVLLYHHIGNSVIGTEHLSLTISTERFHQHMRWLRWRGYNSLTLNELMAWRKNGTALPKKSILLTFDDGYEDLARNAFPILEKNGFSGLVFVITRRMGASTPWDGLRIMTPAQIGEAATQKLEIGGHSRTHPNLTTVSNEMLQEEVEGAKADLMGLGITPLSFAYPYGYFDDVVRTSVKKVFPLAFTCEEGLNDLGTDPWLLKRTMVQPGDTLLDIEFRAALGRSPLNWVRSRLRVRSRFLKVLRILNIHFA